MNPENEGASRTPDGPSTVRARKQELARRRRRIRSRVTASAAALFAGAWLFIAVQLISGHDPALAATVTHRLAGGA